MMGYTYIIAGVQFYFCSKMEIKGGKYINSI